MYRLTSCQKFRAFLMATGVRVSFESVGLNAEEYQRFIDACGIVMVSGEDCYILLGMMIFFRIAHNLCKYFFIFIFQIFFV